MSPYHVLSLARVYVIYTFHCFTSFMLTRKSALDMCISQHIIAVKAQNTFWVLPIASLMFVFVPRTLQALSFRSVCCISFQATQRMFMVLWFYGSYNVFRCNVLVFSFICKNYDVCLSCYIITYATKISEKFFVFHFYYQK